MKDFGILAGFAPDRGHRPVRQLLPHDMEEHLRPPGLRPAPAAPTGLREELEHDLARAGARSPPRRLIHALNEASSDSLDAIPAAIREPLEKQFRRAITVALADVPRVPGPKNSTRQHPGRDMLEFCRDREADVLRFTTDTDVWPTNNISESGLRPTKTQQKNSGRADQRRHHPGPPRHPQLHRHGPQTQPRRPHRPARPVHRQSLGTPRLPGQA